MSLYKQEKILAELIEYQSEVFQLTVGSEEKAEETECEKNCFSHHFFNRDFAETEYLTFHWGRELTWGPLKSAIETFFIQHFLKYKILIYIEKPNITKIFVFCRNVLFPVSASSDRGRQSTNKRGPWGSSDTERYPPHQHHHPWHDINIGAGISL